VRVEEELKRKRAELLGEVEELALRIDIIKKQISAINQVIAIYHPAHTAPSAPKAARKRSGQPVPLPVVFEQLNKTAAILVVLREAGEPLSSADCTSRIAEKHGVAADDQALPCFVTVDLLSEGAPHVTPGGSGAALLTSLCASGAPLPTPLVASGAPLLTPLHARGLGLSI
jgi:hypothetical protein